MSNVVEVLTDRDSKQHKLPPPSENMVWIPGGTFLMGSDKHYPEEAPAHKVTVNGFWIDQHTVTNEEFRRFVEANKYVTSAERRRMQTTIRARNRNCSCPHPWFFRNRASAWTYETVISGGPTFPARTGAIPKGRRVP